MKIETPWWAKIIIGIILITSTFAGNIYVGYKALRSENQDYTDRATKISEQKVMTYLSGRKDVRDAEIKGLRRDIRTVDKNVIILSNKIDRAFFKKEYVRMETDIHSR